MFDYKAASMKEATRTRKGADTDGGARYSPFVTTIQTVTAVRWPTAAVAFQFKYTAERLIRKLRTGDSNSNAEEFYATFRSSDSVI